MYDLLVSLKKIIERRVVNIQTLRTAASAGDTTLYIKSAKRFDPCQNIVVYREGEEDGEPHEIDEITDYQTIKLKTPLSENYDTSLTRIQNLIDGGMWVHGIYIGDPPVIPRYPAITIMGSRRSSEWLTLESTTDRFDVDISVYVEAAFYERGCEYVYKLTREIERTLFYNIYPLVSPYFSTVLTEDVSASDTVIRVADDDLNTNFSWFFLENEQYTRNASPKCYLGNGVIELRFPIGVEFQAGDDVIFPGRHFYDSRAESTDYGNIVKNSLLWGSRISYYATQETLRPAKHFETIDR